MEDCLGHSLVGQHSPDDRHNDEDECHGCHYPEAPAGKVTAVGRAVVEGAALLRAPTHAGAVEDAAVAVVGAVREVLQLEGGRSQQQ